MPRVVATDKMPEFAGRMVANRYLLEDKLGSGAYGKVYRALDRSAVGDVPLRRAIKVLYRHANGSNKAKLQQREFFVHRLVSTHRNIVTFHGCLDDALYTYAIMDFCAGGDLFSAITEKRWFKNEPERIKATYLQILDAVQHCHDLGIFHRDIKPENVLCSANGNHILLADFGLSTNRPFSGDFGCGSSYYMSPECIGSGLSHRNCLYSTRHNDIWALGVILTNLSTGRNPWHYAALADQCFLAFNRDNNFLKTVLPISDELNFILKRIFVLDYRVRISIPELRRRIVGLEGMFEIQQRILQPEPRPATSRAFHKRAVSKQDSSQNIGPRWAASFTASDEVYGFSIPEANVEVTSPSPSPTVYFSGELLSRLSTVFPQQRRSDISLVPPGDSSGSSGSGTDGSKGPKTPVSATKPADPDVEIPAEIADFRLDSLANPIDQKEFLHSQIPSKKTKRGLKSGELLRSAFQRLKGLQPNSS